MALRNTTASYGSIAKFLHWLIALLFLMAYCSVYYRHWFTEPKTPPNMTALHLHLSFGISIGVFVLLCVIWRLSSPIPKDPPGTRLEHLAAKAGHGDIKPNISVLVTASCGNGQLVEGSNRPGAGDDSIRTVKT